jgi:hypothetical protein
MNEHETPLEDELAPKESSGKGKKYVGAVDAVV